MAHLKKFPIFKKDKLKNIDKYHPISNLCSTSKLYLKLILLRIQNIDSTNKINLTEKSQLGLKNIALIWQASQFKHLMEKHKY